MTTIGTAYNPPLFQGVNNGSGLGFNVLDFRNNNERKITIQEADKKYLTEPVSFDYNLDLDDPIRIGKDAGEERLISTGIAIGYEPLSTSSTDHYSIGLGYKAGETNASVDAICIGKNAGLVDAPQGGVLIGDGAKNPSSAVSSQNSVFIGKNVGSNSTTNQCNNAVYIGKNIGNTEGGNASCIIGNSAGYINSASRALSIGREAGYENRGLDCISIGLQAGYTCDPAITNTSSIAIGTQSAYNNQGQNAISIGITAGYSNQSINAVAIGSGAAYESQGPDSIALGADAASNNQSDKAISIGENAGRGDATNSQGVAAIAIGANAQIGGSGDSAIAIGANSTDPNAVQHARTIVINATNTPITTENTDRFYLAPIRSTTSLTGLNRAYVNKSGSTKYLVFKP